MGTADVHARKGLEFLKLGQKVAQLDNNLGLAAKIQFLILKKNMLGFAPLMWNL